MAAAALLAHSRVYFPCCLSDDLEATQLEGGASLPVVLHWSQCAVEGLWDGGVKDCSSS